MPRWKDEDRTPLAAIRANAGLTREDAAHKLGIVAMSLYRYESGQRAISLDLAEDMAVAYGVQFDAIRQAARELRKTRDGW